MANQQFKMSMLRSVQQNMPNMPNVSTIISSILNSNMPSKRGVSPSDSQAAGEDHYSGNLVLSNVFAQEPVKSISLN